MNANAVVEFRQIDPRRNRFRKYLLSQQATLFGQMDLVIHWGRIGRRLRMRSETFGDQAALERRWDELSQLRRHHGYVVVCPLAPVGRGLPTVTAAVANLRG